MHVLNFLSTTCQFNFKFFSDNISPISLVVNLLQMSLSAFRYLMFELFKVRTIFLTNGFYNVSRVSEQSYATKLDEKDARTLLPQLIDVVEYCPSRGVYHRALKAVKFIIGHEICSLIATEV